MVVLEGIHELTNFHSKVVFLEEFVYYSDIVKTLKIGRLDLSRTSVL